MKKRENAIAKDYKLADDCFSKLFCSMQLVSFETLYAEEEDGGFDFSKRRLQNFNNKMTENNRKYLDGELSYDEIENHFKKVGFDCEKEANRFPYRAKMKMINKKFKSMKEHNIMLSCANVGIRSYLILAIYTLKYNCNFTHAMIRRWWESCISNGALYAEGLTDKMGVEYFETECDLKITF